MESPTSFKFPSKPLQPLSPERVSNMLPASPSLPEMHAFGRTHGRTNSDVQGLVKRFEHLDVRDRDAENSERRKRHELELRRAQIAREEAESDVKRLREEVRRLKKEGDEGRERERKVGKRLEVVMDEYGRFKETSASQTSVYEKEVRKAKKEAFKTSSAVLKLQEDLKSMRNTLRVAQANLDMEKRKMQQREQETFDAQYQLVAVQEELEKLRTCMKVVEEERDALKTSLQKEEVARIAAEGMIALPAASQDDDDLMSSPKKSPHKRQGSPLSDDKENAGIVTKKMMDTRRMQQELAMERRRREHAEELADFLKMECQFNCCGCNTSERHGSLSLSNAFNEAMENIRSTMREVFAPVTQDPEIPADVEMEQAPEPDVADHLERSMTLAHESPEEAIEDEPQPETPRAPPATPMEPEDDDALTESTTKVALAPSSPQTPAQAQPPTPYRQLGSVRTITTTTTVPMHFTPAKPVFNSYQDAEDIPPTVLSPRERSGSAPSFDREAALAAIAYRRGRAKSMANGHVTPRKQMIEGVSMKERRDISAPALGAKQKNREATNATKGSASVGRGVPGSAGRRLG
ncbi:Hypothetical predicted protein [Lecanosticta acicola]|uniref:Uncharacterized protein n=1 Tax=Lecanosticta acicola TaxID=111012 RepID=A0AAI8Z1Z7_9PEZI|nr:Hypothetical predicted protein [Lecanosticta acicola]